MKNYTPIDDLIKESYPLKISYSGSSKEMPLSSSAVLDMDSSPDTAVEHQEKTLEIKELVEHEPPISVQTYIQPRPETIKLDSSLKKMGATAATTLKFTTQQTIKLPLSDGKILQGLHAPIGSSWRWLAEFCQYILKQAHIKLKVLANKPVRVREGRF